MWANGKAIEPTSSGDMSRATARPQPPAMSVWSVWRTPLGSAVLPEV